MAIRRARRHKWQALFIIVIAPAGGPRGRTRDVTSRRLVMPVLTWKLKHRPTEAKEHPDLKSFLCRNNHP